MNKLSFLLVTGAAVLSAVVSDSSAQSNLPDHFHVLKDNQESIEAGIEAAKKRAGSDKFWLAYKFDARENARFDHVRIHDRGGISIYHSGHGNYYEDEDLKTTTLRALSNLGDEEAAEKLKGRRTVIATGERDWALFYLFDANSRVNRIKLFDVFERNDYRDYPVFWLSQVKTPVSFDFLKGLVLNAERERVIKPAIFVLSLHNDENVIPFLTQVVGGDQSVDIRGSAALWLANVPEEASLDALVELYPQERSQAMKEKIIFAMSQHDSERVLDHLDRIARNDRDLEMREKAIFWIGQEDGERSLDFLLQLLGDTRNSELKEKIVFSISQHDSERAIDALIKLARDDESQNVREKAIFWLGQIASRRTLNALGDIVEDDPETELKTRAVFAISQHDNEEEAVDMLIQIAKNNPNAQVRSKAIFWLGQTGSERSIDFFKEVLTK